MDKTVHQNALIQASQFLDHYRRGPDGAFDLSPIPMEFRSALYRHFEDIQTQIAETMPTGLLGNDGAYRQLSEDLAFCHHVCWGRVTADERAGFRGAAFDTTLDWIIERLALGNWMSSDEALRSFATASLREALNNLESMLAWFNETPDPRSKRYAAKHGRWVLTIGNRMLADAARVRE